jgi:hypothetical protein
MHAAHFWRISALGGYSRPAPVYLNQQLSVADAGLRFAHGHGAYRTFGEILAFNSEGVIEAGPVVFPGDGGRQLHQL